MHFERTPAHRKMNHSHRILLDSTLNRSLMEDGYVKFPLLSEDMVKELLSFYREHVEPKQKVRGGELFHTTSNASDLQLLNIVNDHLMTTLLPEVQKHLTDCGYTIGNYLVKESGSDSNVPAHQDWLIVEEPAHISFNIWVSLTDAGHNSGNLQFVKGSHKFAHTLRALTKPRYFDNLADRIPQYLVDVPTKAGECIVFNQSVIHASRINRSGQSRVSCVIGGYDGAADLLFFYPDDERPDIIRKYAITRKTLLNMGGDYRPTIESTHLEDIPFELHPMKAGDFDSLCRKNISLAYRLRNSIVNRVIGKS